MSWAKNFFGIENPKPASDGTVTAEAGKITMKIEKGAPDSSLVAMSPSSRPESPAPAPQLPPAPITLAVEGVASAAVDVSSPSLGAVPAAEGTSFWENPAPVSGDKPAFLSQQPSPLAPPKPKQPVDAVAGPANASSANELPGVPDSFVPVSVARDEAPAAIEVPIAKVPTEAPVPPAIDMTDALGANPVAAEAPAPEVAAEPAAEAVLSFPTLEPATPIETAPPIPAAETPAPELKMEEEAPFTPEPEATPETAEPIADAKPEPEAAPAEIAETPAEVKAEEPEKPAEDEPKEEVPETQPEAEKPALTVIEGGAEKGGSGMDEALRMVLDSIAEVDRVIEEDTATEERVQAELAKADVEYKKRVEDLNSELEKAQGRRKYAKESLRPKLVFKEEALREAIAVIESTSTDVMPIMDQLDHQRAA